MYVGSETILGYILLQQNWQYGMSEVLTDWIAQVSSPIPHVNALIYFGVPLCVVH